jgi:hypothetical protein
MGDSQHQNNLLSSHHSTEGLLYILTTVNSNFVIWKHCVEMELWKRSPLAGRAAHPRAVQKKSRDLFSGISSFSVNYTT